MPHYPGAFKDRQSPEQQSPEQRTMATTILPPDCERILAPLLASLPAAAVSPQPPTALLPLLSPILRQRVQLLSASDADPWLPLLCYDAGKLSKLEAVAKDERLEPHPVSGEVELDWGSQVTLSYRRVDEETLQALVAIQDLGLDVKLVWCVNDEAGGGDGWRIGDVGVPDDASSSWGESSILSAESSKIPKTQTSTLPADTSTNGNGLHAPAGYEEDDDDYWAQYDTTPSHTPAPKHSPAPQAGPATSDEDAYYAQYASVQPAMDDHDPDEAHQNGDVETSLGRDEIARELQSTFAAPEQPPLVEPEAALPWAAAPPPYSNGLHAADGGDGDGDEGLAQPRPSSSSGSSGSDTVARLERRAARSAVREQSEVGIKQHISSSLKSLYRLAKVGGIEREEFERLVRTELECLALMDEDDVV